MGITRVSIDREAAVGKISSRLFGSMVEHMGRGVYGGILQEDTSTVERWRINEAVLTLAQEISPTVLRYPGGNYASSHRWEDSIGCTSRRPKRLDLAWRALEPNVFGLHEFQKWSDAVGSETMMCVNLGTRGIEEACELMEYCNFPGGTAVSDLRIKHGSTSPLGIRLWSLGNEVDGPWQIGHRPAAEYARLAAESAKAMRRIDPESEYVLCGTSNWKLPTYKEWDRTVLEIASGEANYLSTHAYFEQSDDVSDFMASAAALRCQLGDTSSIIDAVQWRLPVERRIKISLDEYNIWFVSLFLSEQEANQQEPWCVGPKMGEERDYGHRDAIVFATLLHEIIRTCDRVGLACQAQLVNVLGLIRVDGNGQPTMQRISLPFSRLRELASGLALQVSGTGPTYATTSYGRQPRLDILATWDPASSSGTVFVANVSSEESHKLEVNMRGFDELAFSLGEVMADSPDHANIWKDSMRPGVAKAWKGARRVRNSFSIVVPPLSWGYITYRTRLGDLLSRGECDVNALSGN